MCEDKSLAEVENLDKARDLKNKYQDEVEDL